MMLPPVWLPGPMFFPGVCMMSLSVWPPEPMFIPGFQKKGSASEGGLPPKEEGPSVMAF